MLKRKIQVKQRGRQGVEVIMDGVKLEGVRHVQFSAYAGADELPTMTLEFYTRGAEVEVESEKK